MFDTYTLSRVSPRNLRKLVEIKAFLARFELGIDQDVERYIVAYSGNQIAACGGIAGNVLKSIAIVPELHGTGFSLTLMTELTNLAYEMERYELFLFTKPQNVKFFRQAGFFPVASADDKLVLLENSKDRLRNYCWFLNKFKVEGDKIAGIVMNANPFTLGHQYLLEQAAKECDWLHLIVVREEGNDFSYQNRMEMIKAGSSHIKNITIHAGSNYIISRATFPTYFIKTQCLIDYCYTAIDLQVFRQYIAPALGITHRYVGTEPDCVVTHHYNEQMKSWLSTPRLPSSPLSVVEIPRKSVLGKAISASAVRDFIERGETKQLASFLPQTSIDYIQSNLPSVLHCSDAFAAA